MAYVLLDSVASVRVFSPTLVGDGLVCTIQSSPSGSILIYFIPQADFAADRGAGLLNQFSSAVEDLLGGSGATAAAGVQGVDSSSLIYDAVLFTVTYTPPGPIPGTITGEVEIRVDVITADTSFLGSASAPNLIHAEYERLVALAGQ